MHTGILIVEDQPSTTKSVISSENMNFVATTSLLGAIRHLIEQQLPPNICIIDPSGRHVDNDTSDEKMTRQEKEIFEKVFMKSWGKNTGKMLLEALSLKFSSFSETIHVLSTAWGESDNQNVVLHARHFPGIQVTTRGQLGDVNDNIMVRRFLENTKVK